MGLPVSEVDAGGAVVAEEELVRALASALGRRVPAGERRAWLAMSVAQRERALQRIAILDQWNHDRGGLTIERAADELDVKPKRFYELASAWQGRRSLSSLGLFAAMERRASRLDARAVNIIQKLLPQVVREHRGLSVEKVRLHLVEAALAEINRTGPHELPVVMPSRIVVRRMIERERERLDREAMIGTELHLDYSAVSLFDADGRPFVVFAVLDRYSTLILGHALGDADDPVAGYAAAAEEAHRSLAAAGRLGRWSDLTRRVEIVLDPDAMVAEALRCVGDVVPPADVQFTKPRTNGRYIRKAVGDWLGRAQLKGGLTHAESVAGTALPGKRHSRDEAAVEIARAVEIHNAGLKLARRRLGRMPTNLASILGQVASASAPVS